MTAAPAGLSRYFTYSALIHGIAFLFLMIRLSSAPKPAYYGIDFLGSGAGFGPGAAGNSSPSPEDTAKAALAAAEPEAVPKRTPFVAKDDKKIQIPQKEAAKQKPTKVAAPEPKKVQNKNINPTKGGTAAKTKGISGEKAAESLGGTGKGGGIGDGKGLEISGLGPGGGGGGAFSKRFPYSWYVNIMHKRLWSAWERQDNSDLACTVLFTILRDGSLAEVKVEDGSGDSYYDSQAVRAVRVSSPFPPLPQDFPDPQLRVYVRFKYEE